MTVQLKVNPMLPPEGRDDDEPSSVIGAIVVRVTGDGVVRATGDVASYCTVRFGHIEDTAFRRLPTSIPP